MAKVESIHARLDADALEILDAAVRERRAQVIRVARLAPRDAERVVSRSSLLAEAIHTAFKPQAVA